MLHFYFTMILKFSLLLSFTISLTFIRAKFQASVLTSVSAATLYDFNDSTERLTEQPTRKRYLYLCDHFFISLFVCLFVLSKCGVYLKKQTDPKYRHDDKLTGQLEGVCLSSE